MCRRDERMKIKKMKEAEERWEVGESARNLT